MENENLIQSVKKKLKAGYPAGEIKTELREQGYSEEKIEMIFNATVDPSSQGKPIYSGEKTGNQMLMLTGAGLLITGLAFLSLSSESFIGLSLLTIGGLLLLPFILKRISGEFERK